MIKNEQVCYQYLFKEEKRQRMLNLKMIHYVNYFENETDLNYYDKINNFWKIIYVEHGFLYFQDDEDSKQIRIGEGEMMVVKPEKCYLCTKKINCLVDYIVISFECDTYPMVDFKHCMLFKQNTKIENIFKCILDEINQCKTFLLDKIDVFQIPVGTYYTVSSLLEYLVIYLFREIYKNEFEKYCYNVDNYSPYVNLTINFLKEHIYYNINMKDIIKKVGLSESQLQRLFKKYTGQTIMYYFRKLRIIEAQYLIRNKNYTMSEIAYNLHFSSIHHFSACFKQITEKTPTEYMKLIYNENSKKVI